MNNLKVSHCQSTNPLLMLTTCRDSKDTGSACGWSGLTKVAGRWLQLSIKAGLSCSEAALLVRMFAVERHILSVRNHGICNVKGPALHSSEDHAASLSRDETASCKNDQYGMKV